MLDSLPYEVPVEVIPEKTANSDEGDDTDVQLDDDGQVVLFNKKAQLSFF
jgi:topoisomerase-4 subunit A